LGGASDIHHCILKVQPQPGKGTASIHRQHLLKLFNSCLPKSVDSENAINDDMIFPLSSETFTFKLLPNENQSTTTTTTKKRIDIFDFMCFHYCLPWPLNFVIDENSLTNYSKIFFFLLKIRRAQHTLTTIWVLLQQKRNFRHTDSILHDFSLLR
jgi:hypothetical protein